MAHLAISVIIPTYNRRVLVTRAIKSALDAAEPGDEIIVVDDGSTDDTEQALAPLAAEIQYLRIPHSGVGAARNAGVAIANNPLLAFLDSDDTWMPDKLRLQRALMASRPDLFFCCSDFAVIERDGAEVRSYLRRWHDEPRPWADVYGPGVTFSSLAPLPPGRRDFMVYVGDFYRPLLHELYVYTVTYVVRREMAGPELRFAEDLLNCEDWECYARIARKGPGAFMDCETAWNYGHTEGRLTDLFDNVRAKSRITMTKRVWGSDPAFMGEHGHEVATVLSRQHLAQARWLLGQGRTAEARHELELAGSSPLSYRLLSALPSWLLPRWALQIAKRVRSWLKTRLGAANAVGKPSYPAVDPVPDQTQGFM